MSLPTSRTSTRNKVWFVHSHICSLVVAIINFPLSYMKISIKMKIGNTEQEMTVSKMWGHLSPHRGGTVWKIIGDLKIEELMNRFIVCSSQMNECCFLFDQRLQRVYRQMLLHIKGMSSTSAHTVTGQSSPLTQENVLFHLEAHHLLFFSCFLPCRLIQAAAGWSWRSATLPSSPTMISWGSATKWQRGWSSSLPRM